MNEAAQLAAVSLDRLRDRGWIKGAFVGQRGFCVMGALTYKCDARFDTLAYFAAAAAVRAVIREQFPERTDSRDSCGVSVPRFNDHPDTTFEDVEMVLEKVIAKLEEEV